MKISGFSFVRNGIKYDYPFEESIRSVLPLCDEFVLAVGKSEDDTLKRVLAINPSKIRVIETVWDDLLREGGAVLAQQTNIALDQVTGDWAFYLQVDEVIHERDHTSILDAMHRHQHDHNVEGLLFSYTHFFGSYRYVGNSRRWYRNEIRIIRPEIGVRSWGDAQGFRKNGQKLRVKPVNAVIYHYGWVKPPAVQQAKQLTFNKFWHPDEWVAEHVGDSAQYDYSSGGRLQPFNGTHPAVMKRRVESQNWQFNYDPENIQESLKEKLLNWIEAKTGWRIGEYKNYEEL
ncbi:MAG: glycosyltransferase family 2 protein [Ignavibacteriae bacterium]|nr:glycosyltransferase family 2 protein [Ignavibacteriota bacterium]